VIPKNPSSKPLPARKDGTTRRLSGWRPFARPAPMAGSASIDAFNASLQRIPPKGQTAE
jgi:hypothetical protein